MTCIYFILMSLFGTHNISFGRDAGRRTWGGKHSLAIVAEDEGEEA